MSASLDLDVHAPEESASIDLDVHAPEESASIDLDVHAPEESAPLHLVRQLQALQLALGAVWLLDGALQLQPYMFTKGFVTGVLAPTATGNIGFVSHPTLSIAHAMLPEIATWNALFAAIQLLLGIGIIAGALARRAPLLRLVLAGSFAWAALVWWLGEGLGGVLTGASPLSGAPGAVVLYVVVGLLVWPGNDAPAPLLASRFARGAWTALWTLSAFLLLEPDNQGRDAVSSAISAASAGEPGALHDVLVRTADALKGTGPWLDSLLALVMLAVGAAVALRVLPRVALAISVVLATAIWVFGEAFGGILTGQGTDPNTGPLWVLLALCMWVGVRQEKREMASPESAIHDLGILHGPAAQSASA